MYRLRRFIAGVALVLWVLLAELTGPPAARAGLLAVPVAPAAQDLLWSAEAAPLQAMPDPALTTYADPRVAEMIGQVQQNQLYQLIERLSGTRPVIVGGSPYTISTRSTTSGVPIAQATQYVFEYLQAQGLDVTYQEWAAGQHAGRNVIGVKTGVRAPEEVVLLTAHLDDLPSPGIAPGADDNASGSAGVLMSASILARYAFGRTLRFVFFTGEEQGMKGSAAYAQAAIGRGDNIVGVYNLDMIAWDAVDGPVVRVHTRPPSDPGYASDAALSGVFMQVIQLYGLDGSVVAVEDPDGLNGSDHASFWQSGYPAILVEEDDHGDFNPNYHTVNDRLDPLNMPYSTAVLKAAVGAAAHLAGPASQLYLPLAVN